MENIASFDVCTKPFEVLGLQCFSLKSLKNVGKYPSNNYKLYMIVFYAFLSFTHGTLIFTAYTMHKDTTVENNLNRMMKHFIYSNFTLLQLACLIMSYFKNFRYVQFFRNVEKISTICSFEFHHKIVYKKLRKSLLTALISYAIFYVGINVYTVAIFDYVTRPLMELPMEIISLFPFLFLHMAVIRIGFYVHIVNFHLKVLRNLITGQFAKEFQFYDNNFPSSELKVQKTFVPKNNLKRKVLTLRKIFMLIKEMANHVEETMGIIVLLMLLMMITSITRNGYKIFMVFTGSIARRKVYSKFS